jgi:cytochrome c1
MANTEENLHRWLTMPDAMKPGVHMPPFDRLPERDIDALVAFLLELR